MTFAISKAAAIEIMSLLKSSDLEAPVASLSDVAPVPSSSQILGALARNASESEMLAIAQGEFERQKDELRFRVSVGVYSAGECRPQDLAQIDGVDFVMPQKMLAFFSECTLEYENDQFTLSEGGRVFTSLHSYAEAKGNAA